MLAVGAGAALAAPGKSGKGNEMSQGGFVIKGTGGGNLANPDNGKHNFFGGGAFNNPNVSGF